jgi:hypothetical protein
MESLKQEALFHNEQLKEEIKAEKELSLTVKDNSNLSIYMDTARFNQTWRASKMLAAAGDMVPKQFQGKPESIFVVMELAQRADMSPLMMLQNMYMVHGKPGMEGKLIIALVNKSRIFEPLSWEYSGEGMSKSCTCYSKRRDNRELKSETVTMEIAKKEGWIDKT